MVKTQIQIPDELYRRVKRLAEAQEWTLAETLRRGAELLLASRPLPRAADGWTLQPPANTQLRVDPFADPTTPAGLAWREDANLGTAASRGMRDSSLEPVAHAATMNQTALCPGTSEAIVRVRK